MISFQVLGIPVAPRFSDAQRKLRSALLLMRPLNAMLYLALINLRVIGFHEPLGLL